jgi:hypothetical protein
VQDRQKSPVETTADILDVHVLDVLAQVEMLLRSVREVQRSVLQIRGVPLRVNAEERSACGTDVKVRFARMLDECNALRDAIQAASETSESLCDLIQQERPALPNPADRAR